MFLRCVEGFEVSKVLLILKTALSMETSKIRFRAYRMLIALQDSDHGLIDLNQPHPNGLRSARRSFEAYGAQFDLGHRST